jgi:hypothetical protein
VAGVENCPKSGTESREGKDRHMQELEVSTPNWPHRRAFHLPEREAETEMYRWHISDSVRRVLKLPCSLDL